MEDWLFHLTYDENQKMRVYVVYDAVATVEMGISG